jgi:hypothetical protein
VRSVRACLLDRDRKGQVREAIIRNASRVRDGGCGIRHEIEWEGTASVFREASTLGMVDRDQKWPGTGSNHENASRVRDDRWDQTRDQMGGDGKHFQGSLHARDGGYGLISVGRWMKGSILVRASGIHQQL